MTNFDKFMKVFGEEPDRDTCPIGCRTDLPCYKHCKGQGHGYYWWSLKYKENKE